jgi:hypothetical protein
LNGWSADGEILAATKRLAALSLILADRTAVFFV